MLTGGISLPHATKRIARRMRSTFESGPALLHASAIGDLDQVRSLLDSGAEINVRNARGETPLHLAAGCGRVEMAAYLLSRGADHTAEDARMRRPLGPEKIDSATLHGIRQHYRRTPSHSHQGRSQKSSLTEAPLAWLSGLRQDGILHLPGLVDPAHLREMQAEFAEFIKVIDARRARGEGEMKSYDEEEHFWTEDLAYVSNNAFKHSDGLTRFFCNPEITALAEAYYGKRAFLTRGVAMRYLPHETRENDMFGWHHDLEERRMKVLILLTDVDSSDQVMSYVKGSHRLFHPYKMFFRNSVDLRYARKELGSLDILETTGRAGDVFLFDSNGIHRGNRRKEARVRDTFFVEFGIDRSNLWGGDPAPHVVAEAPPPNPFAELVAAPKKWEKSVRRKRPTWLENLYDVDVWRSADDLPRDEAE